MKTLFVLIFLGLMATPASSDEEISIDPSGSHHSFPHFWEQMFGSGRAILTLRESYRQDLRLVKNATDVKFVRFHAMQSTLFFLGVIIVDGMRRYGRQGFAPGDVIITGTPPGVAMGMKPEPKFLKAGDVVKLGIAGLGEQTQKIVRYKA